MNFNISKMMKQMQQMQENISSLENAEYKASSSGGIVNVVIKGNGYLQSIKLSEAIIEMVNNNEIDMLEDLILTAVNDAKKQADSDSKKLTSGALNGIPLPPGFKMPL